MLLSRKLLILAGLVVSTLFVGVSHAPTAGAVSGDCYFGSGRCGVSGYGTCGTNDVMVGRSTSCGGSALGGVGSKSELINRIINDSNSANAQRRIGAAFIITSMIESAPATKNPSSAVKNEWKTLMQQSSVNFRITWQTVCRGSWYTGGSNGDVFFSTRDCSSEQLIIVTQDGDEILKLRIACGNPVAWPKSLADSNGSISMRSRVTGHGGDFEIRPGQTVTFHHDSNRNGGDSDTRTVTFEAQRKTRVDGGAWNVGGWSSRSSGNPQVRNVPTYWEEKPGLQATFTAGANADGKQVCERSQARYGDGPQTSGWVCVTVVNQWRVNVSTASTHVGTVMPGTTVTWTHTVQNVGDNTTEDINVRVLQTNNGTQSQLQTTTLVSPRAPNTWTTTQSYTLKASDAGRTICQFVTADPGAYDSEKPASSAPGRCVTVGIPPVATDYVKIRPYVNNGADIEPTEATSLTGAVEVTNFPVRTDWGYNEIAKYGTPKKVSPTQGTYGSLTVANEGTATKGTTCKEFNTDGTCAKYEYFCSGQSMGNFASAPTCYRHTCRTYTALTTNGTLGSYQCWDKWTCPSPSTKGTVYTTSKPDCQVWQCAYDTGTTGYYFDDATDGDSEEHCEKRCRNGAGPASDLTGNPPDDYNCYQKPSFTLYCSWGADGYLDQVTVNKDGPAYCQRTVNKTGTIIGTSVCATLTPSTSGTWTPNPPRPGYGSTDNGATYRQMKEWGWQINPASAQGCSKVVAKPTLKVLGGDIAVGRPFTKGGGCTLTAVSSSIMGWPHTPSYDASFTQFGAFATKDIYGFATATIGSNLQTQPAKALAFANTTSSGDRYGGGFSAKDCIANHYGKNPGNLPNYTALGNPTIDQDGAFNFPSSSLGASGDKRVTKGTQIVLYHDGDLYISSNILYDRNVWSTPADIPAFKIVVNGNITIDWKVTELNGVYVAQPRVDDPNVGGHIYTCGTNSGEVAKTNLYGVCKTTLTVNGAFIARQVHFGRTGGGSGGQAGTAIRGETSERFNYLPELWLAPWPRDDPTSTIKYDAMNTLPPIL